MAVLRAILYGLFGGVTVLFPVSSSQLLSIIGSFTGGSEETLLPLSLAMHAGVFAALCLSMRGILATVYKAAAGIMTDAFSNCAGGLTRLITGRDPDRIRLGSSQARRLALTMIIAAVPTGVLGYALRSTAYRFAGSMLAQAVCAFASSVLLLTAHLSYKGRRGQSGSVALRGIVTGIMQGLSVLPGFTRTGTVYAAGILTGLTRKASARLSFVMLIPAVFGAMLCEAAVTGTGAPMLQQILCGVFAFAGSIVTMRGMLRFLRRDHVALCALINAFAGLVSVLLYLIR